MMPYFTDGNMYFIYLFISEMQTQIPYSHNFCTSPSPLQLLGPSNSSPLIITVLQVCVGVGV